MAAKSVGAMMGSVQGWVSWSVRTPLRRGLVVWAGSMVIALLLTAGWWETVVVFTVINLLWFLADVVETRLQASSREGAHES